ncbi:receptor-interacting serine/threonine-protein kinase 2 [Callorhinchus milii]|uniref:receptor-interacting serine/threonine-protein kinase 2 n=1 Tax=Callorhinchus milii TaxID=7868 RepID=UPI001C3FCA83|nr:receptor-interacting serine/threonine-protein kinase 2 [Callorhinchus milii]
MNSTPSETAGLFQMSAPHSVPIIPKGDLENLALFQMRNGLIIKARHKHRNIDVSVKFLTNQSVRDRKVMELLKEVTNTGCIQAKQIVPLMGVYSCPQFLGLVTEWMCNGSLDSLIHEGDFYSNLPVPLRLRILLDVAEGMSHLHGMEPPVIHQALKLSNVLLDKDYRAKLSDYSMCKWRKWTSSSTLAIPSNPKDIVYMAPECLQGKPPSTKGDVYSYGMLAYEVLTGRRPHEDKQNLQDIILAINNGARPNCTTEAFPASLPHRDTLIHLITSCWNEEPQKRPQFRDCKNLLKSVFETFDSSMVSNAVHSLALTKGRMLEDAHHTQLFCIDVKNLELPCDEIPSKLPPTKNMHLERNNIVCVENPTPGRLNSEHSPNP